MTGEPGGPLWWGRRFLLCPPTYFGVAYEINPWMSTEVSADPARALAQWEDLVETLRSAGAEVETQTPIEGLPDLVFTANAGLVDGRRFLPSRFRHPERQGETVHDIEWFTRRGFEIRPLPAPLVHEGAGDALPFWPAHEPGPVLLSGYRTRSDAAAGAAVSAALETPVRSVELVDPRLYHLDLVFCPLDGRHALVAPQGLDHYGLLVVKALVPEPIFLEDEEALAFSANSVVVGSTVVMPACSPRLGHLLEGLGFDVAVVPVDEFQKAGGGCRCLTLALDTTLSESARRSGPFRGESRAS